MRLFAAIVSLLAAAPAFGQSEDLHAPWDAILEKYLTEHPDGVNRFDYAGLRNSPSDRAALED